MTRISRKEYKYLGVTPLLVLALFSVYTPAVFGQSAVSPEPALKETVSSQAVIDSAKSSQPTPSVSSQPAVAQTGTTAPSPTTVKSAPPTTQSPANPQANLESTKKASTPAPQFHITSKFNRSVQRFTGLTWVSEVVADHAAKIALQRKLGGNVKVKIKSYSMTDLIHGKVESVQLKLTRCNIKDIPIGEIQVATANPVWYQYHKRPGHTTGLRYPVLISLKAHMNQQDVTTALADPKVAQQLRGLKLDLPGLGAQQLQVISPKVHLTNGLITIEALLLTQGASEDTAVPITISGRPVLVGDKIVLQDMKVDSPEIFQPALFAAFAEDLLNPIVDFSRMDRKDHAFRLKDLAVLKDAVDGGGQLLLVPKQEIKMAGCQNVGR